MSQSFFRSMMEVSRQCRGGLFALITNSPDQQKIGEKAFFAFHSHLPFPLSGMIFSSS